MGRREQPFNIYKRKNKKVNGKFVLSFQYSINPPSGVPKYICDKEQKKAIPNCFTYADALAFIANKIEELKCQNMKVTEQVYFEYASNYCIWVK